MDDHTASLVLFRVESSLEGLDKAVLSQADAQVVGDTGHDRRGGGLAPTPQELGKEESETGADVQEAEHDADHLFNPRLRQVRWLSAQHEGALSRWIGIEDRRRVPEEDSADHEMVKEAPPHRHFMH